MTIPGAHESHHSFGTGAKLIMPKLIRNKIDNAKVDKEQNW